MKKIMTSLALALIATAALAQQKQGSFSFVPRVGVTIANLTDNDLTLERGGTIKSKSKPGFAVGADAFYQLTDQVALSAGVVYTSLGSKYQDFDELRAEPAETDEEIKYTAYTDNSTTTTYIAVPVMAHVYVAQGLALKAGVQVGMLTSAKSGYTTCDFTQNRTTGVRTYSQVVTKNEDKSKDGYSKTDFSIPVGISYEYMSVVLDARYNLGLSKVHKDLGSKTRSFTFSVGYRL